MVFTAANGLCNSPSRPIPDSLTWQLVQTAFHAIFWRVQVLNGRVIGRAVENAMQVESE